MSSGERGPSPCSLTSPLCPPALRLAGTMAPFFSNPNAFFFFPPWRLGRGQETPTEVTKPSLMERLHTAIAPERPEAKKRLRPPGGGVPTAGAWRGADGEEETSLFHSCQEALTRLPFTETQRRICRQPRRERLTAKTLSHFSLALPRADRNCTQLGVGGPAPGDHAAGSHKGDLRPRRPVPERVPTCLS